MAAESDLNNGAAAAAAVAVVVGSDILVSGGEVGQGSTGPQCWGTVA